MLARLEQLIDVVTLLANLIIIGGAECSRIRGSIALQFSVNSDFTIAWLVYVTCARLLVDKTDYTSLTVRVRVELRNLGVLLLLLLLRWLLRLLLPLASLLLFLGCHLLGILSPTGCLNSYFPILASRLRVMPTMIFRHNFLHL